MDSLIVFNNGKSSNKKYELNGIYDKTQINRFYQSEDYICIIVNEHETELINKALECDFSVVYDKNKKNFSILKKPYNCSFWNGIHFETEFIQAKEELNALIEFRYGDKEALLQKCIKIKFYLDSFKLFKNKDDKVNVFSKYFTKDELQNYYEYFLKDLEEIIKKIENAKEMVKSLTKDDFISKKEEIILKLTLNYIKEDYEFGELSIEDVKLYYKLFIENLKKIPFKTEFIPVSKIKDNGFFINEHLNYYEYSAEKNNNHFMKNNKIGKLGMDVYKNGTFWALFALRLSEQTYEIVEGNFRLGSVKTAILNGDIPRDFKMLTVTNEISKSFETVTIFLPYVKDLEKMKNHPYYKFLYRCPNLKLDESKKFFHATFERDYIVSYGSSFVANCINIFGIGLNNYIFKYNLSPNDLEGNEYINNLKYEKFWSDRTF